MPAKANQTKRVSSDHVGQPPKRRRGRPRKEPSRTTTEGSVSDKLPYSPASRQISTDKQESETGEVAEMPAQATILAGREERPDNATAYLVPEQQGESRTHDAFSCPSFPEKGDGLASNEGLPTPPNSVQGEKEGQDVGDDVPDHFAATTGLEEEGRDDKAGIFQCAECKSKRSRYERKDIEAAHSLLRMSASRDNAVQSEESWNYHSLGMHSSLCTTPVPSAVPSPDGSPMRTRTLNPFTQLPFIDHPPANGTAFPLLPSYKPISPDCVNFTDDVSLGTHLLPATSSSALAAPGLSGIRQSPAQCLFQASSLFPRGSFQVMVPCQPTHSIPTTICQLAASNTVLPQAITNGYPSSTFTDDAQGLGQFPSMKRANSNVSAKSAPQLKTSDSKKKLPTSRRKASAVKPGRGVQGRPSNVQKVRGDGRKCRKIYGMDKKSVWCTACKWKKACTRFGN